MRKFSGIHLVFGLTGLLIFIVREICRLSPVNINIHDTYFVVPSYHISLVVFFIFQFFAFAYYGFGKLNRPLEKRLGYFHYGLTTVTIVSFFILPHLITNLPWRITPEYSVLMNSMRTINLLITTSVLLFIAAQLLFLINIAITIFKKRV